jgi:hypothetical protein
MKFGKAKGTRRARNAGPWMPKAAPEVGLSPEEERVLEHDDLAELLAATNAKRAARGKAQLSTDEIELGLWATEQEMRRSSGS